MRGRTRGIAFAFLAALALANDGMLCKLGAAYGASPAISVAVKNGMATVSIALALLARGACGAPCAPHARSMAHLVVGTLFCAMVEGGFTLAFQLTTSANVLSFTALAPIWGALMSRAQLRERVRAHTSAACALALCGSLVVASGVARSASGDTPLPGRAPVAGTLVALLVGLSIAGHATSIRSAAARAPGTQMLSSSLCGFALAACAGVGGLALERRGSRAPPFAPPPPVALFPLALDGGVCMCVALISFTAASRLAPPADVALVLQLEGLLGPLTCFAALGEVPARTTLAGGACVLAAVVAHEAAARFGDGGGRAPERLPTEAASAAAVAVEPAEAAELAAGTAVVDAAEAPLTKVSVVAQPAGAAAAASPAAAAAPPAAGSAASTAASAATGAISLSARWADAAKAGAVAAARSWRLTAARSPKKPSLSASLLREG